MTELVVGYGSTGWSGELTRRLRVLLHAKPLLDLRLGDTRVAEDLRHYDSLAIGLRILDLILEASGFDRGIDAAGVRRELTPLLAAMDARAELEPDGRRHDLIASRVLGALLNDADGRKKFTSEYVDVTPDGRAEEVHFDYRLVGEHYRDTDGAIELRLTFEAVNLYLGSLDRDIEDEQIATEALIQAQLARGSFSKARRSAEDAHTQSWLYSRKIRDVLTATRRDLRQVDWHIEVPVLLSSAREHVNARLAAERAILSSAGNQFEHLTPGSEEARHVTEITALVKRCLKRHSELSAELLRARTTFLDEQGRQSFALAAARAHRSFNTDILAPMLALPVRQAVRLGDVAMSVLSAPVSPRFLDLEQIIEWQVRPRRAPVDTGIDVEDRTLTALPPQLRRFPAGVRAQADQHLLHAASQKASLLETIQRLSRVNEDHDVIECFVLRALQSFGQLDSTVRVVKLDGAFHFAGIAGDNFSLYV